MTHSLLVFKQAFNKPKWSQKVSTQDQLSQNWRAFPVHFVAVGASEVQYYAMNEGVFLQTGMFLTTQWNFLPTGVIGLLEGKD